MTDVRSLPVDVLLELQNRARRVTDQRRANFLMQRLNAQSYGRSAMFPDPDNQYSSSKNCLASRHPVMKIWLTYRVAGWKRACTYL